MNKFIRRFLLGLVMCMLIVGLFDVGLQLHVVSALASLNSPAYTVALYAASAALPESQMAADDSFGEIFILIVLIAVIFGFMVYMAYLNHKVESEDKKRDIEEE